MSATEKKIDELRAANLILKQCLAKRNESNKNPLEEEPSTSASLNKGKQT